MMGARERVIMMEVDGMEVAVPRKKSRADKFPKQSNRAEVECVGVKTFHPSKWQKNTGLMECQEHWNRRLGNA